jgi:hypothetical protein
MSEETTPQPESIPSQIPIPPKTGVKRHKGVLENLPVEVREDMENVMRTTNPSAAYEYMKTKYGAQFPILNELPRTSFHHYFKKHKVKMAKELSLQIASAAPPKELLTVIENLGNPQINILDKRAALTALFNAVEARNKLLLERQANFLDPYIEKLLQEGRKEQRVIIEKVTLMQDQLSKESDKDWLAEAVYIENIFTVAAITAYKLVHQDQSKYSLFMTTLTSTLTDCMKAYRLVREALTENENNKS